MCIRDSVKGLDSIIEVVAQCHFIAAQLLAGGQQLLFNAAGQQAVLFLNDVQLTVLPVAPDLSLIHISDAAHAEFRNAVWGLYEAPAREKLWSGGFVNPAENSMTLVDYGQVKVCLLYTSRCV